MITVPEAARRTGRHPETIRRWIRSGRLASQLVGTQHLIDEDHLVRLTSPGTLTLPDAWRTTDSGESMPDWETLITDGRRTH
ncbi:MAG: helix-turn-helix domain-containing protein [Euzebya sp.]